MVEQEPESGFREVVHQRVRLGILAVLDRQGACTFPQLRDALGQSDGALSRHLGVLEDHGYISTEKVFENKRPRTWVRLTPSGDEAFREEQELLGKLLARAGQTPADTHEGAPAADRERDERTTDMTIVFAALLAGPDDPAPTGAGGDHRFTTDAMDHSVLVPDVPVLAGRRARAVASGPVSARYELPADYAGFGAEQREQRLMMISHGLRGGWIATWDLYAETDTDTGTEPGGGDDLGRLTAHALVLELGAATDCEAILATMGPATVELPSMPQARAYLLPGHGDGTPATFVAWLSAGPFLASVVVLAMTANVEAEAGGALEHLATEIHQTLSDHQP